MNLGRIKPISYIKANAAEVIKNLAEVREPYIITQNGEATAVLQDIHSYRETQETLALLQLLMMGERDLEAGRTRSIEEVRAEFDALLGEAD